MQSRLLLLVVLAGMIIGIAVCRKEAANPITSY